MRATPSTVGDCPGLRDKNRAKANAKNRTARTIRHTSPPLRTLPCWHGYLPLDQLAASTPGCRSSASPRTARPGAADIDVRHGRALEESRVRGSGCGRRRRCVATPCRTGIITPDLGPVSERAMACVSSMRPPLSPTKTPSRPVRIPLGPGRLAMGRPSPARPATGSHHRMLLTLAAHARGREPRVDRHDGDGQARERPRQARREGLPRGIIGEIAERRPRSPARPRPRPRTRARPTRAGQLARRRRRSPARRRSRRPGPPTSNSWSTSAAPDVEGRPSTVFRNARRPSGSPRSTARFARRHSLQICARLALGAVEPPQPEADHVLVPAPRAVRPTGHTRTKPSHRSRASGWEDGEQTTLVTSASRRRSKAA